MVGGGWGGVATALVLAGTDAAAPSSMPGYTPAWRLAQIPAVSRAPATIRQILHPTGSRRLDPNLLARFDRYAIALEGLNGVIDLDRAVSDPARVSGDLPRPGEAGSGPAANAGPASLFAAEAPQARGLYRAVARGLAPVPAAPAPRPQIALTFDDIPAHGPLPPGGNRLSVATAITAALRAHRAPAFGFMNKGFGVDDPASPQVIAAWRAAGLPLGNHGYGHLSLSRVGADLFLTDVKRNEPALAATMAGADWHWFRYPFLDEGRDAATREKARAGLREGGYRIAAVTMSFGDFLWNDAYARCAAKGDAAAIAGLERSFLAAARAEAVRARAAAQAGIGRDMPYVLLLHLGAFDARMLPRLLTLYEEMGFGFTTLAAAEADPFYAAATDLSRPGPSVPALPTPAGAQPPAATLCS